MSVILTRSASTGSAGASGGAYTQAEKLAMEMEMSFKASKLSNYSEFTYSQQGDLTDIDIYESDSKVVTLFTKDFAYKQGNLTDILLTRISDGVQLLKLFTYSQQGDLTTITVSAGP
jgi:hypothetical protein